MGGAGPATDSGTPAGTGGGTAGVGGTGSGGAPGGAGGSNQCADGMKNGAETDLDCGGGTCDKCDVNKACSSDGDCKTGSCSRLFCALVSGPPNWLSGPPLNYGRGVATVGLATSGGTSVLFAQGGRDDGDSSDPALNSYELLYLDRQPVAWIVVTPTSTVGSGAPATDANGDLLLFGETSTWRFSSSGAWTTLSTAMPTPRSSCAAAAAANGLIYVMGGDSSSGVTGVLEAYDPSVGKWTTGLAAMPTPRDSFAATVGADGQIYAIGGSGGAVEAYNVTTGQWSTRSALPDEELSLSAANAADGRIYAIGGVPNEINAYSTVTNRWTPVTPLSDSRTGVGAVVAPDGHLYAIGGTTNVELTGEPLVQIYGPAVTVTPQQGAPGGSVTVSGSNFAADATVGVYFGSVTGSPVASGTTDRTGTLNASITLTVPSLAAGAQTITVMDDRSQYPITIAFRVQ